MELDNVSWQVKGIDEIRNMVLFYELGKSDIADNSFYIIFNFFRSHFYILYKPTTLIFKSATLRKL